MIVVSDATPLNILVRIGLIDILPALFGKVVIPPAVGLELSHDNTPQPVKDWLRANPSWLSVVVPKVVDIAGTKGIGEREAICLAREIGADLLLVDDRSARATAIQLGIATVGTVGVLEQASLRGLIPLPESLGRLRSTDFFIDDAIIDQALRRDANKPG